MIESKNSAAGSPTASQIDPDGERWYAVTNIDKVPSPALLVYPIRIEENIRRMLSMAGETARLRPHVKTHKMAEVVRLQQAAGIEKFKWATIAEAEMLARCPVADVLLAYQMVGPNAHRFASLVAQYPDTRFSTIVDDARTVRQLDQALAEGGQTAEVLLDVDVGMQRTGVAPGPHAVTLYLLIDSLPSLTAGGLHAYDGHLRDRDLPARIEKADAAFATIDELRNDLIEAGLEVPRVVVGGTPTFPTHARREGVECSPGTCLLWDAGYAAKLPDLDFLHAAVVATRVVSKTGDDRLCLDLGHKAIAADSPNPRVILFDLPDARTIVHNEEHLTIETGRAAQYRVGDVLYGVPVHICPTCALHREAYVVNSDGRVDDRWPIAARDRILSI